MCQTRNIEVAINSELCLTLTVSIWVDELKTTFLKFETKKTLIWSTKKFITSKYERLKLYLTLFSQKKYKLPWINLLFEQFILKKAHRYTF